MLKKIGKEWGDKSHLSPSQINKLLCQWYYDYNVLTPEQRKRLPPNMKMVFGGIVGQAVQDIIVNKLTIKEVMEGKK